MIEKKMKEREAALKVIRENEQDKRVRDKQRLVIKAEEAEAIQHEIKSMEEKERKRLAEVAARAEKIDKIMNSMGENIVHKDKEL